MYYNNIICNNTIYLIIPPLFLYNHLSIALLAIKNFLKNMLFKNAKNVKSTTDAIHFFNLN